MTRWDRFVSLLGLTRTVWAWRCYRIGGGRRYAASAVLSGIDVVAFNACLVIGVWAAWTYGRTGDISAFVPVLVVTGAVAVLGAVAAEVLLPDTRDDYTA
jgi:hypothetical protein